MFYVLKMGIVALKYHLTSTEKIIKEEKFQICLPSLGIFSWRFVNIGSRLDHFSENNIDGGILCLRRANMFIICNYMS